MNKSKTVQSIIAIFLFFFSTTAPSSAFSQSKDLVRITVESVKCIKPSTGQDAYTSALFTGIEIAIQAAAAVATSGTSLGASAALQFGKEVAKEGIKLGINELANYGAQKIYTANKDQILGLANKTGLDQYDYSKINQVLELTSLEGMFNTFYGESPDALYIKVNGNKIWPGSKSVSIKSQQQLTVNASATFERSRGVTIQLMEYDYASNDDDLGAQFFEITPSFSGTDRIVDQVFLHKEEGSIYLVTFRVETLLKQNFIKNLAGSSWEMKEYTDRGIISTTINFGESTYGVSFSPDPKKTAGFSWRIDGLEAISLYGGSYKPGTNNDHRAKIRFTSKDAFSGETVLITGLPNSKINRITGVRSNTTQHQQQNLTHRFINNLAGTSWNYSEAGGGTYTFNFGNGTIDNFSYAGTGWDGATWKVIGNDKIQARANNGALMDLTFTASNSFTGYAWNNNKTLVSGFLRQTQNQQQNFQHRFINNIIGTTWNYSESGGGSYTFNFGNGTIDNFSFPGAGWEGATWKVIGNDKIQLQAVSGSKMDLTFTDAINFNGYAWNNNNNYVTGTYKQEQYQEVESFNHQFINNIIGTSWTYNEPGSGTHSFTIGQGKITNFTPSGTFWDQVTWTYAGTDVIELKTTTGATMNLVFNSPDQFSGQLWNDGVNYVSGSKNYTQNQQQFQHQFINELVGTSWDFIYTNGGVLSFTIGNGTLYNFSTPGSGWEGTTWKIIGNDKIQLSATNGAKMDLTFDDFYNFSGYDWNNYDFRIVGHKK